MNRFLVCTALLAAVPPACSAQQDGSWRTDFENRTVPMEEIVPGGPPKDGIPPIDRPTFVSVSRADRWLEDREPVVMVRINGEAKAYPLQILIWHEIVNDEVGGVPVTITFCPLCNTALAFDRRHDGQVLDFGTTGWLRHSDLVMYDRQTETWWQQATGEAIVGEMAGDQLDFLHAPLINWETFKETYPDGSVLSKETGHSRPYGQNPYEAYDSQPRPYSSFFFPDTDARLPAMERIAAVQIAGETVAFSFSALEEQRAVHDEVGGVPLVVFWAPGTASALDAGQISRGRDVGSSGVYRRTVDGRQLTFEPAGDGRFRDRETGSTWDVLGRAVGGALEGSHLTPVQHGNHFWFAWAIFKPETRIVG